MTDGGAGRPDGAMPAAGSAGVRAPRRRRWVVLAAVVAAGVTAAALVATDPFASAPPSQGGVADNSTPTSLQTVVEESLSSQTQLSATLGYAGSYSVALPSGTTATAVSADQSALAQAQAKVADDETALATATALSASQDASTLLQAESGLSSDEATLLQAESQLTSDERLGCPASSSATVTTPISGSVSPGASSSGSPGGSTAGSPGANGSGSPGTTSPHGGGSPHGATGSADPATTDPSGPTGTATGATSPGSSPATGAPQASTPATTSAASSGAPSTPAPGSSPAGSGGTTTTTIPAPTAPQVSASAPSGVASDGAGFSGTVDPDGAATTYRFVYGATASYGSETPAVSLPAGTSAVPVSAEVAHLEPDTTYLFALEATNAIGTVTSPPQSFSTLQSSCAAERLVIASDVQSVALARDTLATDRLSAGSTVTSDSQQLATDQQQVAADGQALSLAEAQVTNPGTRFTSLPAAGQRIARGQSVYALDGREVPLLYGSVTPYRALYLATSGADVAELQANLVALGFGRGLRPDGRFGVATEAAVKAWQTSLGAPADGVVSLGDVVVEPGAIRVESVSALLGQAAQPGGSVLSASSVAREVTIDLDAAQQSEVKVGDPVVITLPDSSTTPGVISSVGTVATAPSSNSPGGSTGNPPTITVEVTPTDPGATGYLDQAPVEVSITLASVAHALVVPVDALLALSGGGYALEEVTNGVHHLVGVTLGLFDDADGLVQVSGTGVAAGQRVVVPSL